MQIQQNVIVSDMVMSSNSDINNISDTVNMKCGEIRSLEAKIVDLQKEKDSLSRKLDQVMALRSEELRSLNEMKVEHTLISGQLDELQRKSYELSKDAEEKSNSILNLRRSVDQMKIDKLNAIKKIGEDIYHSFKTIGTMSAYKDPEKVKLKLDELNQRQSELLLKKQEIQKREEDKLTMEKNKENMETNEESLKQDIANVRLLKELIENESKRLSEEIFNSKQELECIKSDTEKIKGCDTPEIPGSPWKDFISAHSEDGNMEVTNAKFQEDNCDFVI